MTLLSRLRPSAGWTGVGAWLDSRLSRLDG